MKHLSILLVVFVFTKTTVSWHGKVKSFGRDAVLGQLYDARTDTFFSQSIAKEGMPDDLPDIRHLIQSPWTSVGNWEKAPRFPGESSIFSYGELERIELLADYVEAKGSTGFFKEGRLDPHASIIVHPFESRTDYEKIYFSIFEPYLNREPLETNVDATHVVAGIWRGRDSLVLLEDINGKKIDTDYAFGLLEDSTEPNARDLNVTVKIFTDIPPPTEAGYPKTATELRGKYPDIFQHIINYNDERGVNKLYVMAEIGLLRTYFNVTGIETPEFDDTVRFGNINIWPMSVFEQISEFEIKLREIRNRLLKIPSFRQTVLKAFDEEILTKWEETVQSFKQKLMEYINLSRSKEQISSAKIQSLQEDVETIENYERNSEWNILNYKYKVLLQEQFHELGIPYYVGQPYVDNASTVLIFPPKYFAGSRSNLRKAYIYFLNEVSGSKAVIDCDFPNQFCGGEGGDPQIVSIQNGELGNVIEY